jgi:chitinase
MILAGPWNPTTGHASNLYSTPQQAFSADLAITTYINGGAPAGKLVLGIPYYGKGWAGVGSTNNGLYQPSSGAARGTFEAGTEDYKKLVSKNGTLYLRRGRGRVVEAQQHQFLVLRHPAGHRDEMRLCQEPRPGRHDGLVAGRRHGGRRADHGDPQWTELSAAPL